MLTAADVFVSLQGTIGNYYQAGTCAELGKSAVPWVLRSSGRVE